MSRFTPPTDRVEPGAVRAFLLLCAILFAVAVLGWFSEAQGGTVCQQFAVAPQLVAAPAYLSYTQTGYASNTLNLVGQQVREQAAAQWQAENASLMAEVQAFLAARAAAKAQQPAPQPQAAAPAWQPPAATDQPLPPPAPQQPQGQPPYAWAGETPTIVQHCGKCHRDGYTPEGPAGGVFLDGSTNLRAKANWELREAINRELADRRMPPDGHAFSGAIAGQIFMELYAGLDAGGNPASPEPEK